MSVRSRQNSIQRMIGICVIIAILCSFFKASTVDVNAKSAETAVRGSDEVVQINNYEELVQFAARVNGGETSLNAVLTADINSEDEREWIPIGSDAEHKYVGVFDGKGYSIVGISNEFVSLKPACSGLFGYIGIGGVVKNITVTDANIIVSSKADSDAVYVGAVAGYNEGTFKNIHSGKSGNTVRSISSNDGDSRLYAGGLVGYNAGTITDSDARGSGQVSALSNNSNVTKQSYAGGIAGYNGGTVSNCSCDSGDSITAESYSNAYVGAIAGYNGSNATIVNCENCGSASLSAETKSNNTFVCAGGIAGYNLGTITNSVERGTGTIRATYSLIKKESSYYAGGIAGYSGADNGKATIVNCYSCASESITAESAAGGLVGCNGANSSVENAYFCGTGEVKADYVGGVAGENTGSILNCYYDEQKCSSNIKLAVANAEDTGAVCGLPTVKMVGTNAIGPDSMNFTASEGAASPWLTRESDSNYSYYPHLKGFTYDTTQSAEDWPSFTLKSTYEIDTYEKLKEFAALVNAGNAGLNAIVSADIDAGSADDWIPIGVSADTAYSGIFDGCGHTITGLSCTINKSDPTESQSVYVGLFGYIGQGGVVKNIGIVNPKINANAISSNDESAQDTDIFVGAVAGLNDGNIQQCYLSGSGTVGGIGISPCVKNTNVNVGALVGKNEGTIQDCYNCGSTAVKAGFKFTDDYNKTYKVDSKNETNAGGIVGYNSGLIKNCYNCSAGKITAAQSKSVVSVTETEKKVYYREVLQSYAGAIVGSMSDGSAVENCYYDFWRSSLDRAVGNKEFAGCKLTTEAMTKGTYTEDSKTYVENMPGFSSEIWLVKGSESGSYFYPHLKGFAYDTETRIDNWPPKVSELESRNPSGDEAALCALTISSNKPVSNSDDDAGVSITDACIVKINGIKAGTVLVLMYLNDASGDGSFIGWYSNETLVTDSSAYELIISEDVEFEIKFRDENERIIKYVADLNGEKQIWGIGIYTTNDDIRFPKMNFYGFTLDGWKVNGGVNNANGTPYTTEEAENEVAYRLGEMTTVTVEGVFSLTREAVSSSIPGLDGKYTVTVCRNDVVVERLFRDFAASEYFTFNADEIERYVDTTGKTFSHWLLDDVKLSSNREVTFRVAKDCVLNAVYVSNPGSSIKLTKATIDNADNMKLEAEVNCENSDDIDSVTFRYQVADKVITGKKDDRSYAYTATVSAIDVNETYAIQPVVIFNDGSEPMECKKEVVIVDGGMIVSPTSHFQYDETSLITKMIVSIDNGNMVITTEINSECVAKVLKVRFRCLGSKGTKEVAGTKDDATGKYTATISDIDVDKVYSIQPVVTIHGEPVEGTRVEVLPKHGYDSSEKACVAIVDMKTNDSGVIVAEHIFVPAGCIISRVGVLMSIGSDKVSNASVLDTVTDEHGKIYNTTIQALSGKIVDERGLTCTHTWTEENIGQDKKVYVLAYLVYYDKFNKQHVVCGTVKTMND